MFVLCQSLKCRYLYDFAYIVVAQTIQRCQVRDEASICGFVIGIECRVSDTFFDLIPHAALTLPYRCLIKGLGNNLSGLLRAFRAS